MPLPPASPVGLGLLPGPSAPPLGLPQNLSGPHSAFSPLGLEVEEEQASRFPFHLTTLRRDEMGGLGCSRGCNRGSRLGDQTDYFGGIRA